MSSDEAADVEDSPEKRERLLRHPIVIGVAIAVLSGWALGLPGWVGDQFSDDSKGDETTATTEPEVPEGEDADNPTLIALGDSVDFYDVHITLGTVSCGPFESTYEEEDNADQCVLTLTVRNDGRTRAGLPSMNSTVFVGDEYYNGSDSGPYLFPGEQDAGEVKFTVPKGSAPNRIELVLFSPSYGAHEPNRYLEILIP